MTEPAPLIVERQGAVVRLILNRPAAGNAIDVALAKALMEAAIDCDEDPTVRCVVLTGAGRMFCVGGDVKLFASAGERIPHLLKELTSYLHSAVSRLARMQKPLITVVNGPAAGAGFSLALLGDIALASPSASFTLAYGKLGLSPDGGSTWLLPRLIGLRNAQELMLTDPTLSAARAAELGLVTRVCDAEDAGTEASLSHQAEQLADQLSRSAVGAWGRTRELLLGAYGASLEAHLEAEARAIALAGRAAESREGISAFVARRPAEFISAT
ncbi:1,2-epoxyphenylacetyl-CoA isomerase [Brevundimonas sp. SH203]|uniref:enoyl-CoA hydratase/isomerase family protein n=1 Tax=Brevundimonas sp. SH203 TaxID=345167 RepID=UPI0009D4C74C|nr:enoyl-CoA hydratase/isomerase family protein [Brevundimonas sp. SH203]GAW41151.1 1,2-epoxyphenylacetyl-CoA isomerase [Brevundimonas sp. SH203]